MFSHISVLCLNGSSANTLRRMERPLFRVLVALLIQGNAIIISFLFFFFLPSLHGELLEKKCRLLPSHFNWDFLPDLGQLLQSVGAQPYNRRIALWRSILQPRRSRRGSYRSQLLSCLKARQHNIIVCLYTFLSLFGHVLPKSL